MPSRPSPPPGLRLAVVGRTCAGKTALLSHLQSAWPAPPAPPPRSPPPQRAPNPLLARLSSSRLAALAQRGLRALALLARLGPRAPSCTTSLLGSDGAVWDACGASGTPAVAAAMGGNVDVVLFVTRLDDSRVTRADRLVLADLIMHFGDDVLEKTLVVFTHGCATPPAGIPFQQFVRGRRDLLWRYVLELLPPVEVPGSAALDSDGVADGEMGVETDVVVDDVERTVSGDEEDVDVAGMTGGDRSTTVDAGDEVALLPGAGSTGASANGYVPQQNGIDVLLRAGSEPAQPNGDLAPVQPNENGAIAVQGVEPEEPISSGDGDEIQGEGPGGSEGRENQNSDAITREQLDRLVEDAASSDNESVSGLPDDMIGAFHKRLVHPEDKRVFADPYRPPVFVAELSEACPRDEHGQKTLPDGTAWLPVLLDAVATTAIASRARAAEEAERMRSLGLVGRRPRFWGKLGEMLLSLCRDRFRFLVAEIAIVVLCMQIGAAAKNSQERRRRRLEEEDDDSTLLEMSDEEYKRLTTPDSESGRIVIPYDKDEKKKGGDRESEDDSLWDSIRDEAERKSESKNDEEYSTDTKRK